MGGNDDFRVQGTNREALLRKLPSLNGWGASGLFTNYRTETQNLEIVIGTQMETGGFLLSRWSRQKIVVTIRDLLNKEWRETVLGRLPPTARLVLQIQVFEDDQPELWQLALDIYRAIQNKAAEERLAELHRKEADAKRRLEGVLGFPIS